MMVAFGQYRVDAWQVPPVIETLEKRLHVVHEGIEDSNAA
jgi:hypothetical protein